MKWLVQSSKKRQNIGNTFFIVLLIEPIHILCYPLYWTIHAKDSLVFCTTVRNNIVRDLGFGMNVTNSRCSALQKILILLYTAPSSENGFWSTCTLLRSLRRFIKNMHTSSSHLGTTGVCLLSFHNVSKVTNILIHRGLSTLNLIVEGIYKKLYVVGNSPMLPNALCIGNQWYDPKIFTPAKLYHDVLSSFGLGSGFLRTVNIESLERPNPAFRRQLTSKVGID